MTAAQAETLKVLVVDDTPANRQILNVFLNRLGFQVILAEDGAEAIAAFAAVQPDIVLMDVMMPGMDGFQATGRIKALCPERWVPVVYLTALDKETDLVAGLDAGGDDYLTKPVSFVVLDAKLRSLKRTLALQRALEETRQRTQTITDSIVDGVITIDERGVIDWCNPSLARMFGYEPEELLGREVNLLMPEPESVRHQGYVRRYLDGGEPHVFGLAREVLARHRDGSDFHIRLGVSEVSFGGRRLFVGVVSNITEAKAAEQKLRENGQRLQRYHDQQEQENVFAREILERQILREGLDDPNLKHWLVPAANFSGDILAAARSPTGRLYAMLGDATGHGLSAAISAFPAVTVFYGMVERDLPLSVMVGELNRHLRATLPVGRFFAASLFCGDPAAASAELWIGGMPEVLLLGTGTGQIRRFPSMQPALGIVDFDAATCAPVAVPCSRGEQFVMFSDGLLEAVDARGEEFGAGRLLDLLGSAPKERRLEAVKITLGAHIGAAPPRDDISLMMIDC